MWYFTHGFTSPSRNITSSEQNITGMSNRSPVLLPVSNDPRKTGFGGLVNRDKRDTVGTRTGVRRVGSYDSKEGMYETFRKVLGSARGGG